jgi:hypothetical protein
MCVCCFFKFPGICNTFHYFLYKCHKIVFTTFFVLKRIESMSFLASLPPVLHTFATKALKIKIVCKSACQFVYHGTVGALCRPWNNRRPIFSPPTRQPTIQKLPKYGIRAPCKYGMRALCMLYKISSPYFIKVHISYV